MVERDDNRRARVVSNHPAFSLTANNFVGYNWARGLASRTPQGVMKALTALAAAAFLLTSAGHPASTAFMPISEIRPGMTGVGRTVFAGTERDEFKAHILGVLRNVIGPKRDLILARLEGGPLAQTGVLEGMSGSPVYIDGRLIGAVAYTLGPFSKEAIAGITPIAEMTDAVATPGARAGSTRPRLEMPVTPERLTAALREMYERVRPTADRPEDVDAIGVPRSAAGELGPRLRPIATPLVIGGFSGAAADMLHEAFRGAGFAPVAGSLQQPAAAETAAPLQPGDAVGVSLVRGDYELGATGTVTHVDGSRVYAFGHPFFNLGPTQFPMTRAHVYSLLPSLMISSKISALGDIIGTVDQDRATAIAGTLGPRPRLVPVTIALDSERGARRALRFEVVHDEFFTPLLTFLTIVNSLTTYERQVGSATFVVKGSVRLAGHAPVIYEDLLTGPDAVAAAATYVAGPVALLMSNTLESVRLEAMELSVAATEKPRTATLERVWVEEARPRAGQNISLKILVRTYGGEERVHTVPVTLPASASDSLSILVSDGAQLTQWEQRELRRTDQPQNVIQLVRKLNDARKRNRLYVRLFGASGGAVVHGETLMSLPPSVLAVLEAERAGGRVVPIRSAILGAWEVATDYAVTGSRVLPIKVEPAR